MTTCAVTLVASAGLAFSITLGSAQQFAVKWEVIRAEHPGGGFFPLSIEISSRTHQDASIYRFRQMVSSIAEEAIQQKEYPRSIVVASSAVLFITFFGALVGYFVPGPITGAILPVAVTLWWGLYRVILRHDQQVTIGRQ